MSFDREWVNTIPERGIIPVLPLHFLALGHLKGFGHA